MISVVIPTFNEKENIKKILVKLQEIKIISETLTTPILSKSLSNIDYSALEDEDCKGNENCKYESKK